MQQASRHARPKSDAPPKTTNAPRLLAVAVFVTAAVAMVRGVLQTSAPPSIDAPPSDTQMPAATIPPTISLAEENPPPPAATPTPEGPLPIGIVAGHWGNDAGAICDGGLEEVEINLDIAQRVVQALRSRGYEAQLLEEFDDRLAGYRAQALVSIHADSCLYPEASGFKVARVEDSAVPGLEDELVDCLITEYQSRTGLTFHANSITLDMTRYHTFYEIDPQTPGVIIEVGFMLSDRDLLLNSPDLVARGIVDGILCFVERRSQ
jgi:N-acetylmuramoyl-L-alanine amidase